jgi:hypothetical protein
MVGFAKTLILGRQFVRLATLPQSHGLSDVSQSGCRIAHLKIQIQNRGVFQEFNDVVSPLNRIRYFGDHSLPQAAYLSSTRADQLVGLELSLPEVLGRIPNLHSLFFNTFGEIAKTDSISLDNVAILIVGVFESMIVSSSRIVSQLGTSSLDGVPDFHSWTTGGL